ncbi:MAG: M20/M25/M40 family metallo-hydrolase [Candidatus Bathyarchaeota archaeon]|nr:M20/M25/M40 family metallo-hydrolase [Candidatus Bathyarchaeota archaeon]
MAVPLWQEVESEVTAILSELIRIDTTNPPGNETKAAKYIAEILNKDGFQCEIFEPVPQRGSVVTRFKGSGEKPNLLFLSHLDVVAAKAAEWSVNPFGGVVKDGFVWGRGALDMKGMTAIEIMVLKLLKRNNTHLKGDVILAATADEEMGGLNGAMYLLQKHPEKIFAPYVLNEGGGWAIPLSNKNLYTIQTAEKGLLWFKVKAKGTPGHGSMPDAADNAIMRMHRVIDKLCNYRGSISYLPVVKQLLEELSKDKKLRDSMNSLLTNPQSTNSVLAELSKTMPAIVDEIRPRISMTITPTIIHGGIKENVVPSECEAVFDCRILPGQTIEQAQKLIKQILVEELDKLSVETIQAQEPSESSIETPLYQVISNVLKDLEPNCGVAPLLMAGGTDSRFFRRLGSVCYGFHPMRSETCPRVKMTRREHGVDERISVENLVFGTRVLYETVTRFLS